MIKPTSHTIADPLYFHRTELANKLLVSLQSGITHALTLFAPRRMGKTQFLLNDVKPLAEQMGFHVFYFSFMDHANGSIGQLFTESLVKFLNEITQGKSKLLETLKNIKQFDVLGVGVELTERTALNTVHLSAILQEMAEKSAKPILMLLDEVQELAREKSHAGIIKSLRTGLDTNQNKIKVIFTGSSTNGLRAMFNDNKAPFFHFAYPLDFPTLDRSFTDFLANIYQQRTNRELDKAQLFQIFERFNFTPLYLRAIAQDMIIDPELTLEQAAAYRFAQMHEQSDTERIWRNLSLLEQELLKRLTLGERAFYGKETRKMLANLLGVDELSTSTIQGKIKKLERNEIVTRQADGTLKINNPHFETWIMENQL